MSKKLIDLHKEWMEVGKFNDRHSDGGNGGLCNAVPVKYIDDLKKFEPNNDSAYWASTKSENDISLTAIYGYNQLRQTIVLLICAMNNEI